MSNKLKKEIKNKHILIDAIIQSQDRILPKPEKVECIVTNDSIGKTLSIIADNKMITFAFEQLEKYLK